MIVEQRACSSAVVCRREWYYGPLTRLAPWLVALQPAWAAC